MYTDVAPECEQVQSRYKTLSPNDGFIDNALTSAKNMILIVQRTKASSHPAGFEAMSMWLFAAIVVPENKRWLDGQRTSSATSLVHSQ